MCKSVRSMSGPDSRACAQRCGRRLAVLRPPGSPRRLRRRGGGADEAFAARIGADRGRQHARDRGDRTVEAEFAQHREAGERIARDGADRGHEAERDRQIVVAAFLRQIGGREVDGDAPGRQRQSRGDERGSHALARLGDGLVRQAHDVERGQAGRDLNLNIDGAGLDALERHGGDALNHAAPACAR
jgi:hypothetical protein